jgi:hypothetical protein
MSPVSGRSQGRGGGVHLQLVLARRRVDGGRLRGASGQPSSDATLPGLKYTDDRSDARWLAHVLRLGVLPEGYIYPKAERAVRDI